MSETLESAGTVCSQIVPVTVRRRDRVTEPRSERYGYGGRLLERVSVFEQSNVSE